MERVADIFDPRLASYSQLTDVQLRSKFELEQGLFIAESAKVIRRAMDGGYEPVSLLVPEHRIEREANLIHHFEGLPDVEVFAAPKEELEKLSGYEITRGVLAAFKRKALPDLNTLLDEASRIAVLENITNHANIGSIFRNAAALDIDAIIASPECSDPLYRRAIRVSMGSVFKVPWTHLEGEGSAWHPILFDTLRQHKFQTAALALADNAISIDDPSLKDAPKLAMFFGTEGDGLSQSVIDACDHVVKIPMHNGVDSLNVAASSAIAFWELRKR